MVGRLLGPKGMTLKAIQTESRTRISILGRGSIKDRKREEELRNSNEPMYEHLKDDLHIQIEAMPPFANMKLAAGVSEIDKMLIPPVRIISAVISNFRPQILLLIMYFKGFLFRLACIKILAHT